MICEFYDKTSDDDILHLWRLFFKYDNLPKPPSDRSIRTVTQISSIYAIKIGIKYPLLVDTPRLGQATNDSNRILNTCSIELMIEIIVPFVAVHSAQCFTLYRICN